MREFRFDRIPRPNLELTLTPPFDVEIGAGQGLHAVQYCRANPQRRLLAIERTHNKYARLKRRSEMHPELTGLHPLHADGVAVLTHFVPAHSLERVFLLYPNPYPKSRQANLRWHNSPFMGFLISRLAPNGELHLATNLKWYALEAKSILQERWGLRLLQEQQLTKLDNPRTHFERKYLERGECCYDFIFTAAGN